MKLIFKIITVKSMGLMSQVSGMILQIFRNALMTQLEEGERVQADNGYNGEDLHHVKCPMSMS